MPSALAPMPTAGRRNRMLLLVFGSGAAIGLHLGLLHVFLWRSLWALPAFVPTSLIFSAVTYSLWRWVFPRFGAAPLPRRIGLESLVTVVVLTCLSAVLTEAVSRFLGAPSLFGSPGGDELHITITPEMRQRSVQMYALLPIVPTLLMTIIGYHQYWARVLTLQTRERELAELAATAQLAALRAQMNPHFLFNSLNSIAQLIHTDPDKVRSDAAVGNGVPTLPVGDDRPGMPPPALERVYERGVGLRNLRDRLARLYGVGHLPEITSAPGTGTRVRLRLPIRPIEAAA